MGEDLENDGMMSFTTDQFLKAIESIIDDRKNSLNIVNDDELKELTWEVNIPAELFEGAKVTGEPNPWNYRRDILPIKNLRIYFEIMMKMTVLRKLKKKSLKKFVTG